MRMPIIGLISRLDKRKIIQSIRKYKNLKLFPLKLLNNIYEYHGNAG